jgi:hypothetical protein
MMGVEVPIGGDANSIYRKAQFDLGVHHLQHLSEESTDKRNTNNRLSNMAEALPEWKKNFNGFCIQFPENGDCPSNSKSIWFKNQRSTARGLRKKAEFEESHMNDEWLNQWNANNTEKLTGTEWRDNRDMFDQVLMKRWGKEY